MANYGLTDLVATVTLPKSEYEELIRDSERVQVIERYMNGNKYASATDIAAILGIEKGEE